VPPEPDLRTLLRVAEEAALAGGRIVLEGAGSVAAESKAAGDYVTDVDRKSERVIADVLRREAVGIPVVGEEMGGDQAPRWWVVDPLDGTTNFLHRFPAVAVSVALVEDGRPVVGVVHAPFLDETYRAARGAGARVTRGAGPDEPLAVSDRPVERAIVGTGFPFRRKDLLPRYLATMTRALERFEDLRRPGAAALDLAWVASGVFDGFFELALNAWDVAAGALLIEEAGGVVTDWEGGAGYLSGDILAGSPPVHPALLELARP
jgi:myo-inositol-1(or 4)-monophosphatase